MFGWGAQFFTGGAVFNWGAQIIKSQGAHFDGVKFWRGSAAKYCNLASNHSIIFLLISHSSHCTYRSVTMYKLQFTPRRCTTSPPPSHPLAPRPISPHAPEPRREHPSKCTYHRHEHTRPWCEHTRLEGRP